MAKKNVPKNNNNQTSSFSIYMYLVAIVALVAIFYIVLMQKNVINEEQDTQSANSITGNAILNPLGGNRDNYGLKVYFVNNPEDWSRRIEVLIQSADEPVTDVIHKAYGVGTHIKFQESAKELGTLSCTISKEGSYGRIGHKNDNPWNQVKYDCKAVFPSMPTYETSKRHTIAVVDSYGNVALEQGVDRDHPENTEFKYGTSTKKKVYFGTVLDRWELDKS